MVYEIPIIYPTILQEDDIDDYCIIPNHHAATSTSAVGTNNITISTTTTEDPSYSNMLYNYTIVRRNEMTNNTTSSSSTVSQSSLSSAKIATTTTKPGFYSCCTKFSHIMTSTTNNSNYSNDDDTIVTTREGIISITPISSRKLAISRMYSNNSSDRSSSSSSISQQHKVIHVDLMNSSNSNSNSNSNNDVDVPIIAVQSYIINTTNDSISTIEDDDQVMNDTINNNNNTTTTKIVQIVIVDASANIYTLYITIDTLQPIRNRNCTVQYISVIQELQLQQQQQQNTTTTSSSSNNSTSNNSNNTVNPTILQKQMISFVSSNYILIAYNPYLLLIDITTTTTNTVSVSSSSNNPKQHNHRIHFWSYTQCMNHMIQQYNMEQSSSSLLYTGISMIYNGTVKYMLGNNSNSSNTNNNGITNTNGITSDDDDHHHHRNIQGNYYNDSSVAAVVCSNSNTDTDINVDRDIHDTDDITPPPPPTTTTITKHIFTLHSDGIVRHWTVHLPTVPSSSSSASSISSSIQPSTVHEIYSQHIPDPLLWIEDDSNTTMNYNNSNNISMYVQIYNETTSLYNIISNNNNEVLLPYTTPTGNYNNNQQHQQEHYILILQIQTSEPIPYDTAKISVLDDSQRPIADPSNINIIAIDGIANISLTDIVSSLSNITTATTTTSSSNNSDSTKKNTNLTSGWTSSIRLTAPNDASNLIDIHFVTSPKKYQPNVAQQQQQYVPIIHAMYYSYSNEQTTIVSYTQSINTSVSLLSKDPIPYLGNNNTTTTTASSTTFMMDDVKQRERDCIESLSYYDHVITAFTTDHNSTNLSVNETENILLQELDKRFMQFLFRPSYHVRSTGTVLSSAQQHPQYIYKAMKIVSPSIATTITSTVAMSTNNIDDRQFDESNKIELDVYKFIQRWRQEDHHKNTHISNNITNGEVDDDKGSKQYEIILQQEEERWKLYLFHVWQLEQINLFPLRMYFINTSDTTRSSSSNEKDDDIIIVRSGYITVVNVEHAVPSRMDNRLDEMIWGLLSNYDYLDSVEPIDNLIAETITNNIIDLPSMNRKVLQHISNIKLPSSILDEINALRKSDTIDKDVQNILNDTFSTLRCTIPGLGGEPGTMTGINKGSIGSAMSSIHIRLSATFLLIRSLNTIRNLSLARYIVLYNIQNKLDISSIFFTYLRAMAAMYVGVRMVPSSSVTKFHVTTKVSRQLLFNDASMRSRMKSILEIVQRKNNMETIALDPLILQMSQKRSTVDTSKVVQSTLSSYCDMPIELARLGLMTCLTTGTERVLSSNLFPELDMLVMTSGEIEHPELALRLLAVSDITNSIISMDTAQVVNRTEWIAMCLINISRSKKPVNQATYLMTKALEMLPFDVYQPATSMDHLRILENQIGKNHLVGSKMLHEYINKAIEVTIQNDIPNIEEVLHRLYNASFNCLIVLEQWDEAYKISLQHLSGQDSIEKLKRLVRAMVNNGALAELLKKSIDSDDLYKAAIEALADMTVHDVYSPMAIDPEIPTDYIGALYALHAAHGRWKEAAQAMDTRYTNAVSALGASVTGLTKEQYSKWEQLVVDDMTLAALSCYHALSRVADRKAQFLISETRNKENGKSKVYMSIDDVEVRGKRCAVLKTLYDDKALDPTFALLALVANDTSSKVTDNQLVEQLFILGFYVDGIELATLIDKTFKGKPNGASFLMSSLCYLTCSILVPLALDRNVAPPDRPTIHQLQRSISFMNGSYQNLTSISTGSRGAKPSEFEQTELSNAAMRLIQLLTEKYTSDTMPLANEVAKTMLEPQRICTPLPVWLEELLLTGNNAENLPGLFARRPKPGMYGQYLGNPVVLLDIYTFCGLVQDACRIVERVFNDFIQHRGMLAASRLPEKGEMDFIPYQKIDLLWNVVTIQLTKETNGEIRRKVEASRLAMKKAMEKYVELMTITKMGMKSARSLQ